jgi:hypothetical protein
MINAEKFLWRAVIARALKDSRNKKISKEERIEARHWLENRNSDFELVCSLADVDSAAVMEKFRKNRLAKKMKKAKKMTDGLFRKSVKKPKKPRRRKCRKSTNRLTQNWKNTASIEKERERE